MFLLTILKPYMSLNMKKTHRFDTFISLAAVAPVDSHHPFEMMVHTYLNSNSFERYSNSFVHLVIDTRKSQVSLYCFPLYFPLVWTSSIQRCEGESKMTFRLVPLLLMSKIKRAKIKPASN